MIVIIIGMFLISENNMYKFYLVFFSIFFENVFEKLNFIFVKVKGLKRLVFSLRIRKQHVQKNLKIFVRHLKVNFFFS
jgi:hypothetical protein